MKKELEKFLKDPTVENLRKIPVYSLDERIEAFRILHGVDCVYISNNGKLFKDEPENFTGKWLWWFENGMLAYEYNIKDGNYHGMCQCWDKSGKLVVEENYINGYI